MAILSPRVQNRNGFCFFLPKQKKEKGKHMNFLFMTHSHFRWLLGLVLIIALFKFLIGWLLKSKFSKIDTIIFKSFSGFVDFQVLVGLIYLIWSGLSGMGFPRFRLEHSFIMIIAAVLPHLSKRWNNSSDVIRYRNGFLIILATAVLIFVGVIMLPGGMLRWTMGG